MLEESSQLIHQGEVTKGAGGAWPKDVTLFLFDHQLVYCKRDLLKRNTFVYRGRLNLDMCEVVDMPANKGKATVVCGAVVNLYSDHLRCGAATVKLCIATLGYSSVTYPYQKVL